MLWDEATPNHNDAQKQVGRMVKVFRVTLAPQINPIAVERRLECRVGEGFILSGQSDMQTLEPGRIRDLKTGTVSRMHFAQIGAYSLLARSAHPDVPVNALCTDFIQRVPLKKEQPDAVVEPYDQAIAEQAAYATIDRIKADIAEFHRRVEDEDGAPEHAFLANPSSMLCSNKFCPAHGSGGFCREFKQKTNI